MCFSPRKATIHYDDKGVKKCIIIINLVWDCGWQLLLSSETDRGAQCRKCFSATGQLFCLFTDIWETCNYRRVKKNKLWVFPKMGEMTLWNINGTPNMKMFYDMMKRYKGLSSFKLWSIFFPIIKECDSLCFWTDLFSLVSHPQAKYFVWLSWK